jgi:hypothetical protein
VSPFILDFLSPAIALLVGIAVVWWGLACPVEWFPRNFVLGYRTRAALSSNDAWHAAHRGYAPFLIGGGFLLAVSGVAAIIMVLADPQVLLGPRSRSGSSRFWVHWSLAGSSRTGRCAAISSRLDRPTCRASCDRRING